MVLAFDGALASTVALQAGESAWPVLLAALCGLVVFIVVALWRIMPVLHKPRVTLRLASKPIQTIGVVTPSVSPSTTGTATSSVGAHSADRTDLLQAKSQWERLIEEANSNDQLTSEQRESFVQEARRSLEEITKQLE